MPEDLAFRLVRTAESAAEVTTSATVARTTGRGRVAPSVLNLSCRTSPARHSDRTTGGQPQMTAPVEEYGSGFQAQPEAVLEGMGTPIAGRSLGQIAWMR